MPTHRIKLVFVGPVLEQQTNALDLTLDGGQVQGRAARLAGSALGKLGAGGGKNERDKRH